jgi:hypothetical protein
MKLHGRRFARRLRIACKGAKIQTFAINVFYITLSAIENFLSLLMLFSSYTKVANLQLNLLN